MSEQYSKKYCTICGKRIVPQSNAQAYVDGSTTITVTLYLTDGIESVCFGHKETSNLPVGGLKDLQCHKRIPQAFYDAFKDEDLHP